MKISIDDAGPTTIAAVAGEVDAENCAEFRVALLESAKAGDLILDLSDLTFIDSSGISELLFVQRAVKEAGRTFELRSPSPAVRRVLEITGLREVFGLHTISEPAE